MGERQSLADRFVLVASAVAHMDDDIDNENPHRYPLRKMKQLAEKILLDAIDASQQVVDTAHALKQEIAEKSAKKGS